MNDNKEITKKQILTIGFTFVIPFLIFGLTSYFKNAELSYKIFLTISVLLFILIMFFPEILKPFCKYFLKFAEYLGRFNTKLFVILIFYFTIIPAGILIKLFRKDLLNIKSNKDTYWIKKKKVKFPKESYKNMF